jgi:isopenicillin-N N-acyltransferase like protein
MAGRPRTAPRHSGRAREVTPDLRIVEVSGAPRELGRAYGEEMRTTIAEGLQHWLDVIAAETGCSGEAYVASFLGATDFLPAIQTHTPDCLEEVRGIAEGAGQSFDTMLAYQLMDEEWWYRESLARSPRASFHACSAVGIVREGRSSLVAQNMDLPSHYDGTQVLLRLRPTGGAETMVFTPAGILGTTGLNQDGVAVCVNALPHLRHRSSGLPVGFVLRGLLAKRTLADAVAVLQAVPHATGQNYLVGEPGVIRDFECSAGQVSEVKPSGSLIKHTNHPLANEDIDPEEADQAEYRSTTRSRLARLERGLGGLGSKATVDDVARTLSDREAPVSVARGSDWMTLGSVIMELSSEPVLHIAPGPPADTPYTKVRFS